MKQLNEIILAVNGGSSSIKFALFEAAVEPKLLFKGAIEGIGLDGATFRVKGRSPEDSFTRNVLAHIYTDATTLLLNWVGSHSVCGSITAIGHRIVHRGQKYSSPVRLTNVVVDELKKLVSIDPEHMANEIELANAYINRFPKVRQFACFDTEFHRDMPLVARLLPIPRRYESKGIRRYGFHGLSYEFLLGELARFSGTTASLGRIVLAHIGSGVSLAAVRDGKSFDTSMSFTPNSGVPMGTRTGDLDPGLAPYLAMTEDIGPCQFYEMVNFKSGLIGISETTPDMRELLKQMPHDSKAAEAVAYFCYRIKKCVGEFAAALGGIDTLIFSGGIGESAPSIRTQVCDGLQFLGIELDTQKNALNQNLISSSASKVTVHAIPTNEELMIAKKVSQTSFVRESGLNAN